MGQEKATYVKVTPLTSPENRRRDWKRPQKYFNRQQKDIAVKEDKTRKDQCDVEDRKREDP
jgi:hypothetical protein